MRFLRRIGRLFEPLAIPHLSLYLVLGQVLVLGAEMAERIGPQQLWLLPARVLAGEWWRVATFLFEPPSISIWFIAFAWYMFYLMGSALEGHWGVGRYNLFLLTGWALTVAVSFVTPFVPASNAFLAGSVFLAFAYLAPEFELALFFILPVKIKWLALIAWIGYAFALATGDTHTRLAVLASTGNFLLFFAGDIWSRMRQHRRRMTHQAQNLREAEEEEGPRHRCYVCGKNSDTHPDLDFRYCSKCAGDQCYCPEHIRNHEHVLVDETKPV